MSSELSRTVKQYIKELNQIQFNWGNNITRLQEKLENLAENDLDNNKLQTSHEDLVEFTKEQLLLFDDKTSKFLAFWSKLDDLTGALRFDDCFGSLNLLDLNAVKLRELGSTFLKTPCKPKGEISPVKAIFSENWSEIAREAAGNNAIENIVNRVQEYISEVLESEVKNKIESLKTDIPDISMEEIDRFREKWIDKEITYDQYVSNLRRKKEEAQPRHSVRRPSLEKKKLRKEREKQLKSFDGYEAYMNADDRTLKRMKRSGKYHLKKKKMRRRIKKDEKEGSDVE